MAIPFSPRYFLYSFAPTLGKKLLFLAVFFFYRLCFGDADFYCISHRFFPFYSFPLLSHWHPLTNFFFRFSFGFRPRFATAAFPCISMAEYPARSPSVCQRLSVSPTAANHRPPHPNRLISQAWIHMTACVIPNAISPTTICYYSSSDTSNYPSFQ